MMEYLVYEDFKMISNKYAAINGKETPLLTKPTNTSIMELEIIEDITMTKIRNFTILIHVTTLLNSDVL